MVFDENIKSLIKAAFNEKNDVFLKVLLPDIDDLIVDSVKTVVFLPGSFGGMKEYAFSDIRNFTEDNAFNDAPKILPADIRFMNTDTFREFLVANNYRRFVIPFCECADSGEYGYRESFFRIGEFREECVDFCQIVAFFSPISLQLESFLPFFACENAVFAGTEIEPDIMVFEASSPLAKFYQTANFAEKYGYKKVCVYFNSRSEAKDFASFLTKRGTAFEYIDGSIPPSEKNRILKKFFTTKVQILLATKSFIPESMFMKLDICLFCGIPFSPSHLSRCSLITDDKRVSIICCNDDLERNLRIAESFSVKIGDDSVYEKRRNALLEIKKLLERGQ